MVARSDNTSRFVLSRIQSGWAFRGSPLKHHAQHDSHYLSRSRILGFGLDVSPQSTILATFAIGAVCFRRSPRPSRSSKDRSSTQHSIAGAFTVSPCPVAANVTQRLRLLTAPRLPALLPSHVQRGLTLRSTGRAGSCFDFWRASARRAGYLQRWASRHRLRVLMQQSARPAFFRT
jgi:hypothetical protein